MTAEGETPGSNHEHRASSDETDDDADRYVHDPADARRPHQAPPEDEFDWRGWVLVGFVVVAFLVVPTAILFLPQAADVIESLGLTLRDAYLVLPLVPAFILGAAAVWAAVRSRS
jgi:hypothetical protein